MSRKKRASSGYVMPVRKAITPKCVVLGDRMELAEVICDTGDLFLHRPFMQLTPNARSSGVKRRNQAKATENANSRADSVNLNSRFIFTMLTENATAVKPMPARIV